MKLSDIFRKKITENKSVSNKIDKKQLAKLIGGRGEDIVIDETVLAKKFDAPSAGTGAK